MIRPDLLNSYRSGRPIVLINDDGGERGAELLISATAVQATAMAFLVRHTSGFVTVALPSLRCDGLDLPATAAAPLAAIRAVPAVAVDAEVGVSTGISATDRSRTARLLADPNSTAGDFTRPGHVVPLRVPPAAVSQVSAMGAAFRLCEEAGVSAAIVQCDLVRDDGPLLSASEGFEFASAYGLALTSVRDLVQTSLIACVA
jgi:3,4-dihydroxy 2-butanone 4-phosphate synthase / GTP cyclohydrolase II